MYNNKIDVAEIMRKIKADDIPPEEIIRFTKNKLTESYNLITANVDYAETYKNIGYRTPAFESIPKFIRPAFKQAYKVFAKVTRYVIKDQNTFNEDILVSLKLLAEGQQHIISAIEYMDDRLEKLVEAQETEKQLRKGE